MYLGLYGIDLRHSKHHVSRATPAGIDRLPLTWSIWPTRRKRYLLGYQILRGDPERPVHTLLGEPVLPSRSPTRPAGGLTQPTPGLPLAGRDRWADRPARPATIRRPRSGCIRAALTCSVPCRAAARQKRPAGGVEAAHEHGGIRAILGGADRGGRAQPGGGPRVPGRPRPASRHRGHRLPGVLASC